MIFSNHKATDKENNWTSARIKETDSYERKINIRERFLYYWNHGGTFLLNLRYPSSLITPEKVISTITFKAIEFVMLLHEWYDAIMCWSFCLILTTCICKWFNRLDEKSILYLKKRTYSGMRIQVIWKDVII